MKSLKSQKEHDNHADVHHHRDPSAMHAKLFFAQRNMYLTGSVIFLSLVLDRFYSMILELVKNEEKTEQQAAKTSKEYLKLLDQEQNMQKKIEELTKENESVKKLQKELEIVKKQAEGVNIEFMKLTDRNAELEKKLNGSENSKSK